MITTQDREGRANFAPMGVVWGEEEIVVKPYRETTTYQNLLETGEAVVNLVDDVLYFVRGALGSSTFPSVPAVVVRGVVLEATILATRTRLLPIDEILAEYRRLQVIV